MSQDFLHSTIFLHLLAVTEEVILLKKKTKKTDVQLNMRMEEDDKSLA